MSIHWKHTFKRGSSVLTFFEIDEFEVICSYSLFVSKIWLLTVPIFWTPREWNATCNYSKKEIFFWDSRIFLTSITSFVKKQIPSSQFLSEKKKENPRNGRKLRDDKYIVCFWGSFKAVCSCWFELSSTMCGGTNLFTHQKFKESTSGF